MSDDWPEGYAPHPLPDDDLRDGAAEELLGDPLSTESPLLADLDDDFWGRAEAAADPGTAPDGGDTGGPRPAEEISLDLEEDPQPAEVGAGPEVEALLDLDEVTTAVDIAVLSDVFAVPATECDAVLARLGLEGPVDGLAAAVVLGELGLDAVAGHGDLDGLSATLAAGGQVVLTSGHGPVALTAVDLDGGFVELRDGATLRRVDLGVFESAWEQAAYAMVVAEPASSGREVTLSTGPVTVLGLQWPM